MAPICVALDVSVLEITDFESLCTARSSEGHVARFCYKVAS